MAWRPQPCQMARIACGVGYSIGVCQRHRQRAGVAAKLTGTSRCFKSTFKLKTRGRRRPRSVAARPVAHRRGHARCARRETTNENGVARAMAKLGGRNMVLSYIASKKKHDSMVMFPNGINKSVTRNIYIKRMRERRTSAIKYHHERK